MVGEQLEKTVAPEEVPNNIRQSPDYTTQRTETSLLTKKR